MDLTVTKIVVLVLLGLLKLLSGLAPLVFKKIFKRKSWDKSFKVSTGLVLCFGGGVLLSTVLIHMMSEVRESLEKAANLGSFPQELEFPFAELLICTGFLLILVIESIASKIFGGHSHTHLGATQEKNFVIAEAINGDCEVSKTAKPQGTLDGSNKKTVNSTALQGNPEQTMQRKEEKLLTSLRSGVVVLALSVHSVFEGMAIGLEESESGVWKLFLAVSIHAVAIVFCIGTEMMANRVRKAVIVRYILVLSVVTPVGVVIGMIVTNHTDQAGGEQVLVIGVLQGLAGGTLLYITFFEVLTLENMSGYNMSRLLSSVAVLVGFGLMTAIEAGSGAHAHGGHAVHGQNIQEHHPLHLPQHKGEDHSPESFHELDTHEDHITNQKNEHDHGSEEYDHEEAHDSKEAHNDEEEYHFSEEHAHGKDKPTLKEDAVGRKEDRHLQSDLNSKDDKIHIVAEFVLPKNQENKNTHDHEDESDKIIDYEDINQNDEINHDHDHEPENFQHQEESIMNEQNDSDSISL